MFHDGSPRFFLFDFFLASLPICHLLAQNIGGDLPFVCSAGEVDLLLDGIGNVCQNRNGSFQKLDFSGICGNIQPLLAALQLKVDGISRLFQQQPEALRSEPFDVFVRILGTGHVQDSCWQPDLAEMADCLLCGCLSGTIAVVGDDDFLGVIGNFSCLFRRDGSSQRCHHVGEAGLIDGDDIHVPLCQDQTCGVAVLGEV